MSAWIKNHFITDTECHVHKDDIPDKDIQKSVDVVDKAIDKMLNSFKVK